MEGVNNTGPEALPVSVFHCLLFHIIKGAIHRKYVAHAYIRQKNVSVGTKYVFHIEANAHTDLPEKPLVTTPRRISS